MFVKVICNSFLLNGKVALLYELIAVFRQPVCNSVCDLPVVHCHYILSVLCLLATVEHHIPLLVLNKLYCVLDVGEFMLTTCLELSFGTGIQPGCYVISFDNESDTETATSEQGLKKRVFKKCPTQRVLMGFIELWVILGFPPWTYGLHLAGTALTGCI